MSGSTDAQVEEKNIGRFVSREPRIGCQDSHSGYGAVPEHNGSSGWEEVAETLSIGYGRPALWYWGAPDRHQDGIFSTFRQFFLEDGEEAGGDGWGR
jgi:hypothetical protein